MGNSLGNLKYILVLSQFTAADQYMKTLTIRNSTLPILCDLPLKDVLIRQSFLAPIAPEVFIKSAIRGNTWTL